jgi:hypothetical protein
MAMSLMAMHAILPYVIFHVHLCSLGYQELSSGCACASTRQNQRRPVVLDEIRCEDELSKA